MSKTSVAVLGAGLMGLTAAYKIQEEIPNASITIYAEDYSPNTTSDFSNGYWQPFSFTKKDCSENKMLKWSRLTYDKYFELCKCPEAGECGATVILSYVLSTHPCLPDPKWSDCVIQYQKLGETELQILGFSDVAKSGFSFLTFTIEMKRYLPFLTKQLEEKGITLKKMKISNLSDIFEESKSHYDFIINCTERGAENLFNDKNIKCIRGHQLILDAPWIKFGVSFDDHPKGTTYILPLVHGVMIGGTVQKTEPASKSDEDEYNDLFERAVTVVKNLKNAKILNKNVGTWAYRIGGTRLELEKTKYKDVDIKIIHNYGHGGSGITIAWGCATEIVEMIQNEIKVEN